MLSWFSSYLSASIPFCLTTLNMVVTDSVSLVPRVCSMLCFQAWKFVTNIFECLYIAVERSCVVSALSATTTTLNIPYLGDLASELFEWHRPNLAYISVQILDTYTEYCCSMIFASNWTVVSRPQLVLLGLSVILVNTGHDQFWVQPLIQPILSISFQWSQRRSNSSAGVYI